MDRFERVRCARLSGARQHMLQDAEIDGVGADPTKEFSGVAGCFDEAETDVVA